MESVSGDIYIGVLAMLIGLVGLMCAPRHKPRRKRVRVDTSESWNAADWRQ